MLAAFVFPAVYFLLSKAVITSRHRQRFVLAPCRLAVLDLVLLLTWIVQDHRPKELSYCVGKEN